jgi:hypothetical protein
MHASLLHVCDLLRPQRIQAELSRSTKRVYLMQPKLFAGHYVSTDNAILLVAVCASVGVAAGVLGGAFLFKAT